MKWNHLLLAYKDNHSFPYHFIFFFFWVLIMNMISTLILICVCKEITLYYISEDFSWSLICFSNSVLELIFYKWLIHFRLKPAQNTLWKHVWIFKLWLLFGWFLICFYLESLCMSDAWLMSEFVNWFLLYDKFLFLRSLWNRMEGLVDDFLELGSFIIAFHI